MKTSFFIPSEEKVSSYISIRQGGFFLFSPALNKIIDFSTSIEGKVT
jgi:hypothetical protein